MKFQVALIESDEGYSICAPSLPGCWSQGATEAEALENIQDAIREYLAVVNDPALTAGATYREVEVPV